MKHILSILVLLVLSMACTKEDFVYVHQLITNHNEEYVSYNGPGAENLNFLAASLEDSVSYEICFSRVGNSEQTEYVEEQIKGIIRCYNGERAVLFFKKGQEFKSESYYALLDFLKLADNKEEIVNLAINENLIVMNVLDSEPSLIKCLDQSKEYKYFKDLKKGKGTIESPYRIESLDDLEELCLILNNDITNALNLHFIQTADITLDKESLEGWTPIGFDSHDCFAGFAGCYDGGNHVISNLSITDDTNRLNVGLFSVLLPGSNVSNLKIEHPVLNLKNARNVGSLCGSCIGASIKNVKIKAPQINVNCNVGGLVGSLYDNSSLLNCEVLGGNISNFNSDKNDNLGGIVGYLGVRDYHEKNPAIIYLEGLKSNVILNGAQKIGGLIGCAFGNLEIKASHNHSQKIVGGVESEYVGGIIGLMVGWLNMKDCSSVTPNISTEVNTKTIEGGKNVGGAIGCFDVRNESQSSEIDGFKTAGNLFSHKENLGGLIGLVKNKGQSLNIKNVYTSTEGSLYSEEGHSIGGLIGYSEVNLYISSSKDDPSWGINNSINISAPKAHDVGGIIGYSIGDVVMEEIHNIGNVVGKESVGGMIGYAKGKVEFKRCAVPGAKANTGKVMINAKEIHAGGYIGMLEDGNLVLSNSPAAFDGFVNEVGKSQASKCGGLVGNFIHSKMNINNATFGGCVSGKEFVGGLVGNCELNAREQTVKIYNVTVKSGGEIFGDKDVAGFIGKASVSNGASVSIIQSMNSCRVQGGSDFSTAGFIASLDLDGRMELSDDCLRECVNTGNIGSESRASKYTGGIVGYVNCFKSDKRLFRDCINQGHITGGLCTGGILGKAEEVCNHSIERIFNEKEAIVEGFGKKSEYANVGSLVGELRKGHIYYGGNYGTVIGHDCEGTGGLVGKLGTWGSIFQNILLKESFNVGKVIANHGYIGGIVGDMGSCNDSEGIRDCYSVAHFENQSKDYHGAVVGYGSSSIILKRIYHYGDKHRRLIPYGASQLHPSITDIYMFNNYEKDPAKYITKLNNNEAGIQSKYVGFDFDKVWIMSNEAGRPLLRNNMENKPYAPMVFP